MRPEYICFCCYQLLKMRVERDIFTKIALGHKKTYAKTGSFFNAARSRFALDIAHFLCGRQYPRPHLGTHAFLPGKSFGDRDRADSDPRRYITEAYCFAHRLTFPAVAPDP